MQTLIRSVFLLIIAALTFFETLLVNPKPLLRPITRKESVRKADVREWMNQNQETLAPGIPRGEIPNAWASGTTYWRTSQGKRSYSIRANEINLYSEMHLIHARTATISVYDDEGVRVAIEGQEAKIDSTTGSITMFGAIVATFRNGLIVRSSVLYFDAQSRQVSVPPNLEAQGTNTTPNNESYTFVTQGLICFHSSEICELQGDVEVVYYPAQREKVILNATRGLWEPKESRLRFFSKPSKNPVRIWNGNLYVHGDEVHWLMNEKTMGKNQLLSIGHALSQEDIDGVPFRRATANRLTYFVEPNKILLKDYPVVQEHEETLIGESIWIDRKTNIVEAQVVNAISRGSTQRQ
jgi:hypothetical protein